MAVYVTKTGDMWDQIAYDQLGSELLVGDLLEANKDYINVVVFDSGIPLLIPLVTVVSSGAIDNTLPPWRSL